MTSPVTGPWKQRAEPLFDDDAGHGMLFRALDERLMLVLHRPNGSSLERPRLFTVDQKEGDLACSPWPE